MNLKTNCLLLAISLEFCCAQMPYVVVISSMASLYFNLHARIQIIIVTCGNYIRRMILHNICLCSKRHSGTRDSDSRAQHHTPIKTSVIAQINLKSSYTDIYKLLGQRPVLSARHLLMNLSL